MELRNGFEPRLRSLQRLCSNSSDLYPSGLLFVPGPDGRHNKGSSTILKFLFSGSIGHDLLEGVLNEELECLEEMILLVQETSVSVVYTRDMKNVLKPWLESCPMLIEYMPLEEEEGDVDLLQARKCLNFKRMILESLPAGTGVGIPIPLGYDGVLDVESWALMQSFALDEICMPTGFFTTRYNVVDIMEFLDLLVRTLDTSHVDNAVKVVSQSIVPHVEQALGVLDALSADQRARLTVSEVLAPLDMLYDFGELHCAEPADPALRPVVYLGNATCLLGATRTQLSSKSGGTYMETKVGANCHVIAEACEPSSGLRWCRTYLLHKGFNSPMLRDAAALVEKEEDLMLTPDVTDAGGSAGVLEEVPAVLRMRGVLSRLQGLYLKLQHTLSWAVRVSFSQNADVLDAGRFVQLAVNAAMKGEMLVQKTQIPYPEGLGLEALKMEGVEQLQVHMDCMNSLGKVVSIEDVDDLGGTCWTYIRVSVHNIDISAAGTTSSDVKNGAPSGLASVAVGDTYLFSGVAAQRACRSLSPHVGVLGARVSGLLASSVMDAYCITRAVPYNRSFVGPGPEDRSLKRFLEAAKKPTMLAALGLGKLQNTDFTNGVMALPLLTDHPLLPFCVGGFGRGCEVRAFTGGLMITKDNNSNIPCLVSFEVHVEQMWTVDLQDCHARALELISSSSGGEEDEDGDNSTSLSTEAGLIVVIQLKSFSSDAVASRLASRTEEEQRDVEALQQELDARRARMAAGHVDVLGELDADEEEDAGDYASRENAEMRNRRRREEELVSVLTKKALQYNPLSRSLPLVASSDCNGGLGGEAKESLCFAFVVPSSSKYSHDMARAIAGWRASLRLHDLPDHKGSDKAPLPPTILRSFALYMDHMHRESAHGGSGATTVTGPGSGTTYRMGPSFMAKAVLPTSVPVQMGLIDVLGQGYHSLRSVHALNEIRRLTTSEEDEGGGGEEGKSRGRGESKDQSRSLCDHLQGCSSPSLRQAASTAMQLVVICGHSGSGALLVGEQLADRIDRSFEENEKDSRAAASEAQVASVFTSGAISSPSPSSLSSPSRGAHCGHVILDFSAVTSENLHADLLDVLTRGWRDFYLSVDNTFSEAPFRGVAVVTVILSHAVLIDVEHLLPLLVHTSGGSAGSHVSSLVGVINAASLLGTKAGNMSTISLDLDKATPCAPAGARLGVGVEVWRAAGLHSLWGGGASCGSDVVVCVDGDNFGTDFASLRHLLEVHKSGALAVRVTPDALRLEESVVELLVSRLGGTPTRSSSSALSVFRKPLADLKGYASCIPASTSRKDACEVAARFARFSVSPAKRDLPASTNLALLPPTHGPGQDTFIGESSWSVNSLLSVLQAIFPRAMLSNDVVSDTWQMPSTTSSGGGSTKGLSGFRLATYCAKAKVLKGKQVQAEAEQLNVEMKKLSVNYAEHSTYPADKKKLQFASGEVLSVHGVIRIPSGTPLSGGTSVPQGLAVLEAAESAILLRTVEANSPEHHRLSNSTTINALRIQGVFDKEGACLVEDLLGLCGKYRLPKKPHRTRKDLSKIEEMTVHEQHAHEPLSDETARSWAYDGRVYVDFSGNQRALRPDIEPMLEAYLVRQNERVDEYNRMVDDVTPLL